MLSYFYPHRQTVHGGIFYAAYINFPAPSKGLEFE